MSGSSILLFIVGIPMAFLCLFQELKEHLGKYFVPTLIGVAILSDLYFFVFIAECQIYLNDLFLTILIYFVFIPGISLLYLAFLGTGIIGLIKKKIEDYKYDDEYKRNEMLYNYIQGECHYSHEATKIFMNGFTKYQNIFKEATNYIKTGKIGKLQINGYTVEKLVKEHNMKPIDAYYLLTDMTENSEKAMSELKEYDSKYNKIS